MLKLQFVKLGALLLLLLARQESEARPLDDTGEAMHSESRNRAYVPGTSGTTALLSCFSLLYMDIRAVFRHSKPQSPTMYFVCADMPLCNP